jgi:peptide/nickel transport system permease protein
MLRFVLRRLGLALPTLFGMSLLIFLMVRLIPGNAVDVLSGGDVLANEQSKEQIRKALGLDHSLPVQYFDRLGHVFRGDYGSSFITGRAVSGTLASALPVTLELTLLATVIALLIGLPLGVASSAKPNGLRDLGLRGVSLFGLAFPDFWLATVLLLAGSLWFHWTPPLIWKSFFSDPLTNLEEVALPAGILAVFLLASIMRMTRTSMLEVQKQDFVRTAYAKGLHPRRVRYRHALRNALLPVASLAGAQVAAMLGGATILETIFAYPGVGYTLTHAIYTRDYPVIQDSALMLAVIVVVLNLLVDLSYMVLDPRVRQ